MCIRDRANELTPDLVISDLMMPKKNGFEVVEALKGNPSTSHIPIILLTAKTALETKIAVSYTHLTLPTSDLV